MRSRKHDRQSQKISKEIGDLKSGLSELKITPGHTEKFVIYLEQLYKYQKKINLISRNDYERISRRHFLVSLIAYAYLTEAHCIADLGSGAGFPGVPLKITMPEKEFVLIESLKKRAKFLSGLIQALALSRISVFPDRAENYNNACFDTILLRAAGKIRDKLKLLHRLLLPGGRAIFYKGSVVEEEMNNAKPLMKHLGFACRVERLLTPVEHRVMNLVILEKS